MKKAESRYIDKLESHIDKASSNLKYSIERFDILIISISSGGLVFSMGFVKDILSGKKDVNFLLLKISWVLFASSILLNLLSQVTGYYANKYDMRITRNIIRNEREKPMKGNQANFECKLKILNLFTNIFNGLSLGFLMTGIILVVIFMSKTL